MLIDCTGRPIEIGDHILVAMSTYNDPYFNIYRVTDIIIDDSGPYAYSKIKGVIVKKGSVVVENGKISTLSRITNYTNRSVMVLNETTLRYMLEQNQL
jgi:hypothetical protein